MGRLASIGAWWDGLEAPLRRLPRGAALAVLVLTLLACLWSAQATTAYVAADQHRAATRPLKEDEGDYKLYQRTLSRMRAGEGYYAAAESEQRAHGYPTRPFVTVRTPTMAWLALTLGLPALKIVAILLLLANVAAWVVALEGRSWLVERAAAALALGVFGVLAFFPLVGLTHEMFAGLLLSLALALHRPHRWWPSLLLAGMALAIREMALPFVLLWGAFALDARRWRESLGLALLLAAFAAGMAVHAHFVALHRLPGDLVSDGWEGMLGLANFIGPLVTTTLVGALPGWLAGPLALLPLLGWAAVRGRLGLFALLWSAGYMVLLSVFARPDNFYWVLLVLPAYGIGIVFVPRALADLLAAALRRGRPLARSGG
ncbi:conserved hypothetical protein [Altererythrobacter sp. B11]|nr:conserved hypothetical protein [Altererythrobacter sp. B11]